MTFLHASVDFHMLLEYQDRRIYRFAETHWLGVDITDGGALRLGGRLSVDRDRLHC